MKACGKPKTKPSTSIIMRPSSIQLSSVFESAREPLSINLLYDGTRNKLSAPSSYLRIKLEAKRRDSIFVMIQEAGFLRSK